MRIEVITKDHTDRSEAVLVLNGKEIQLPKNIDFDNSDPQALAFFAGYATATADISTTLAQHSHDHEH